jgi:hypothetical protein
LSSRDCGIFSDPGYASPARRRFEDPIPLPRGRQFVTLEDAGNYITKLPRTEHATPDTLV